ncbi:MAG: Ni,Fe-hydrogenase III small subunit [Bacteriovoracaceae bacterium]|jgi:Ni,Fe-hydrogenase III small subunit
MINKILGNIQKSLSHITGKHHLRLSIWGNDVNDSFQFDYDFHNYSDSFLSVNESTYQPANIILIIGSINFHQLNQIKKLYDSMESDDRFIVNVSGSLYAKSMARSYMFVGELKEHLEVDLNYTKFPFSLEELLKEIVDLKDVNHE